MVLSLPSFTRSTTTSSTPPLRPRDPPQQQQPPRHRQESTGSSAGKPSWPSLNTLASSAANGSQSTTLSEALRNNPFGSTSRSRAEQTALSQTEEQRREQEELNHALNVLAYVFPDVKIEVFRELLVRFDGQSRLHVCVEQLLRHKKEWVAGRWNVPEVMNRGGLIDGSLGDGAAVPLDELFRSDDYKVSVRIVLAKEFSSLSKSTIDAVLAEVNFSYTRARPILRDLSRKTWRATFNSIFPSFRRKKDKDAHLMLVWQRQDDGELLPKLKETGSAELDKELYDTILAPLLAQQKEAQEGRDFQLAEALNETEAKAADALYECECCLGDITFEQASTCSTNSHIICYNCIQRTTHEALFGQGWGKSIDAQKATLKCLAPLPHGMCDGSLHPQVVKQAILVQTSGFETYRKFEDRLASEALLKSQLKLVRCPFCSYAEADSAYHPSTRGIVWRFRRGGIISSIVITIVLLDLIPLLCIPVLILLLIDPAAVAAVFRNSLISLCLKVRPKRFTCANPTCRRSSCITCNKPWRDPHICHEPLLLDLRATVEAARTAAVKRTCPRCGLSFVKSSGCNKLTCVCGYSMCYLCRKALGPPLKGVGGQEEEAAEEAEGYKHFCEHFRINPGSRCTECNKCDLYEAEDEEAVARRAGEKAEREWRLRQGVAGHGVGVGGVLRNVNSDFNQYTANLASWSWDLQWSDSWKTVQYWLIDAWLDGRWIAEGQALVDSLVEQVVVIEEV
ncbi:hypothetical protein ASPZODRAFT_66170 [Penicilliopsis zonata CBS 506.65]|uniref:RING-type domain-containing protein n=1 Tax=Penicilliopsis zonata CBS 506.65 TaxID=1073090 RepID=A0A1L9SHG2_9EURO|nr:hypothetical protein ASPZODRAFT_66170 [Penicilliopsis zonata CBS 506.65]OJJ46553.1 hypothetical protein ASPZODRAFT_66170 [Penicilliopsis zonata CBS 506.65]